ncbi:UDP-glucose/GDP-mannose dehydrogenase family protein [Pseudonocardia sp.]|uniref:UDP-glucose dehydrogenase family protein n=1 Tax=Pseudonocardia sp. TaxID=60912 RepID=UPI0026106B53|nr:UDP-glucose/GDP-mannose dehydrogenase family protein [Pseudonocardia sp.]
MDVSQGRVRTVSIIGTGYLGTTHAACMAELGFEVVGLDSDPHKVAMLAAGRLPFVEPDLEPLLAEHVATGRLRFTTDPAEAAAADVHFLCVGTPQRSDGLGADLGAVRGSVAALAPHLSRPCLVVGKSTVPVGTAAELAETLREAAPAGPEVHLAWNPEFLREGHAVADTLRPDRLVFGLEGGPDAPGAARALTALREVYADALGAGVPEVLADLPTAELVKTAANSFLATKISFINAMAELCDAAGADVTVLAGALALDERIGGRFLAPGLGFGGGCLPKDIRAFVARAEEIGAGAALAFLREVDAVNLRCRTRAVDLVLDELARGSGRRVAVLGASFKPGSDDVRDSPGLDVAAALHRSGIDVRIHDPAAMPTARRVHPELTYADSVAAACADADVVLLTTEWPQFRDLDPGGLAAVVARPVVIDARHALPAGSWRAAGWRYLAPGRPEPVATPRAAAATTAA